MPLRCAMGIGSAEEERQRAAAPRRGFDDGERPSAAVAGYWRCRSCAAAVVADCVALGCCPCAAVALLGLALARAPLAAGRRLRMRRRSLLRRKRVRDVEGAEAAGAAASRRTLLDTDENHATVGAPVQQAEAEAEELAWLDEMYRAGNWGFGRRVSFSGSASDDNLRKEV